MMAIQKTSEVKTYFTDRARLFDSHYEGETAFERRFNSVFRKPMFDRFVYTLEGIGDAKGKRVLDIGCGSGRYCVEIAKAGGLVTGIELSAEMLKMAEERVRAAGVADRVELLEADFVAWADQQTGRAFDVAFAMGVLDYVEDAPAFIQRMGKVARTAMASFPKPTLVRMPLRKMRYGLRNCPVHFYRDGEIRDMFAKAGLTKLDIRPMGPGYFVTGSHRD
ncbi:MAG: methyltransferase domain-containing protein [Hyphomicrobiaceae bacterium]